MLFRVINHNFHFIGNSVIRLHLVIYKDIFTSFNYTCKPCWEAATYHILGHNDPSGARQIEFTLMRGPMLANMDSSNEVRVYAFLEFYQSYFSPFYPFIFLYALIFKITNIRGILKAP